VTPEQKTAPLTLDAPERSRFSQSRRQKVNVSLHPQTLEALTKLAMKFAVSRGVVLDRATMAIAQQYQTGVCHCAHNRPCPHSRTDVPAML
jgi:hypothetical protein